MWTDAQMLDAIAGNIDSPCEWRLQFWIWATFGSRCVAMLESDGRTTAAYLWGVSPAQVSAVGYENEVFGLSEAPFESQEVCELSSAQASYWRWWPFFRLGEVKENVEEEERDGIWMTMRSFDGIQSNYADLTNPDKKRQPLRWQARNEVFDLLLEVWGWRPYSQTSIYLE